MYVCKSVNISYVCAYMCVRVYAGKFVIMNICNLYMCMFVRIYIMRV